MYKLIIPANSLTDKYVPASKRLLMPGSTAKIYPIRYLNTWQLVLILLGGTTIRFLYGYFSKAWLASPDQLAWGLGIDEMLNSQAWNYTQLSHAPHEGGSFFMGLLSIIFRPLQSILPPLSFVALTIDTVSRFIQIKTAQKLFGNETAFWFGIWTILSVPLLVPWATVNYGLHSLFSFVPFVFFYFANRYQNNKYLPIVCGIICAIAVSFSYDSVVLVLASILFLLIVANSLKNKLVALLIFLITFLIAILPHLVARSFFNTELSLSGASYFSGQGISFSTFFSARHVLNFCAVWFTSFPGSFLLSSINFFPALIVCIIVFLLIFIGIRSYISNKSIQKTTKLLAAGIIFLFIAAYAFSPFYEKGYFNTSYVYYRHLCYIIPFVTVIMMRGFTVSGKFKIYLLTGWIFLCGIASCQYIISAKRIDQPAYRAAGWVLAKKYGNNTNKLFQIGSVAETQYQDELLRGFGWGLSAAILENKNDSASVDKLFQLIRQCPVQYQPGMIQGVRYSFTKGITPVLDQGLLTIFNFRLQEKKESTNNFKKLLQ